MSIQQVWIHYDLQIILSWLPSGKSHNSWRPPRLTLYFMVDHGRPQWISSRHKSPWYHSKKSRCFGCKTISSWLPDAINKIDNYRILSEICAALNNVRFKNNRGCATLNVISHRVTLKLKLRQAQTGGALQTGDACISEWIRYIHYQYTGDGIFLPYPRLHPTSVLWNQD